MFDFKKVPLTGVLLKNDTFALYTLSDTGNGEILFGEFPIEKAQQSVLKRLLKHDFLNESLDMHVRYKTSDPNEIADIECPFGPLYAGIGSFFQEEYDEEWFQQQRESWLFENLKESQAYEERKRIEQCWNSDAKMRRIYGTLEAYYADMAEAEKHYEEELVPILKNASLKVSIRPILVCMEAQELAETIISREKKSGHWGQSDQKTVKQFETTIAQEMKKTYEQMKKAEFRPVSDYPFTKSMYDEVYDLALNYARYTELGRSHVPEYMRARFENRDILPEIQNKEIYDLEACVSNKSDILMDLPKKEKEFKKTLEGKQTSSWRQGMKTISQKTSKGSTCAIKNTSRSHLSAKNKSSFYVKAKSSYYR